MKDNNQFEVSVPATIANIGPGFDTLGIAIQKYLVVKVEEGIGNIKLIGEVENISSGENAFIEGLERSQQIAGGRSTAGKKLPSLDIEINSDIPLKKGLGSSGAARVGGLAAGNKIFNLKLSNEEIAKEAAKLEGHPDNVVPSALGGLTISCMTEEGLIFSRHEIESDLKIIVGVPDIEVNTSEARNMLPEKISFEDAVFSNSRSCLLISAIVKKDYNLLKWAMEDRLHQPYRKKNICGFETIVKEISKKAFGTAIAGSGPSIFSFAEKGKTREIGNLMVDIWKKHGVQADYFITSVNNEGVKIIE